MAASRSGHDLFSKLEALQQAGVQDEEQMQLALQIYLDLSERRDWWNISMEPCLKLQKAVVCGYPTATAPRQVVLPMKSSEKFRVTEMSATINVLTEQFHCNSVIVAITEADSTVVYHKLSNGLVPPDPPEKIEEKQKQRERQFRRKQNRFVDLKTTTLSRTEPASTVTYEPYKTDNSHKGKHFVLK